MVILIHWWRLATFWLLLSSGQMVQNGLMVTDLSQATAEEMAWQLAGEGIAVSNVHYVGEEMAAGIFVGGAENIGLAEGVLLSTGNVQQLAGANSQDSLSTAYFGQGDGDLTSLAGVWTSDAAVLTFDFVPAHATATFRYLFGSDEYNEYANTQFTDLFAFWVNGQNCAIVDELPVSVNSINAGNPQPGEDPTPHHPELYRNNDLDDGGGAINIELDGLTTILTCTANVTPNEINHLKIAIADASDPIIDSAVFLEANSLNSAPTNVQLTQLEVETDWLGMGRWLVLIGLGLIAGGWLWKKWRKR